MIKIIIISDIKIYCEGLRQILDNSHLIRVIGAVSNINDTILTIERDIPDVILLDMTMIDSCNLVQKLVKECPFSRVVALAVPKDEHSIVECAEAGIKGYVARESSVNELIEAIIETDNGEFYCPSKISACIFKKVKDLAQHTENKRLPMEIDEGLQQYESLTTREQQIASLLGHGLSNKHIASRLTIEVSTVKNHVHNILVKLDVKSRTQAASRLQRVAFSNQIRFIELDSFVQVKA